MMETDELLIPDSTDRPTARQVAAQLAELYERGFAGKERGRYRISMKHLRIITRRKRLPPAELSRIAEELFELGYVLIDMETFFVVLAQRTFTSYRRVSDGAVASLLSTYVPQ
jgi:hypothetical protein